MSKFKVGQIWETRGGELVEIEKVKSRNHSSYPIFAGGTAYSKDGFYFGENTPCSEDLIRLVKDIESPESDNALRYNEGKVDLGLIPIDASEAEARVWMGGEKKYGRKNWEKLWGDRTVDVVIASALRHLAQIQKGEMLDSESGEHHAAHVRCNMAMLIRYYNENK